MQNNLVDETQALFERALLIFKKIEDPKNVTAGIGYVETFHSLAKMQFTTQLLLAKPYFGESCRIQKFLYVSNHLDTLGAKAALAAFLSPLITINLMLV
jgi:hypothetical protein